MTVRRFVNFCESYRYFTLMLCYVIPSKYLIIFWNLRLTIIFLRILLHVKAYYIKITRVFVPFLERRYLTLCGPGSSVGIATELRAGRSGIESRWGRDFPPVQTGPGAHLASCKMGTVSFPGVKCCRGVLLTTHPLLMSRSWKSRAIPLSTLGATPGL